MEQTTKPTLDLSSLEMFFEHGELSHDPVYSYSVAAVARITLAACNTALTERLLAIINNPDEDMNYAIVRGSEIERILGIIGEAIDVLKDKEKKYYNETKKEAEK